MPITWITMIIGTLALTGLPGFSGYFSKDAIIEAVGESHRWGSGYAYLCVLVGVFVTALYSFRLLYMTFHGRERFVVEHEHGSKPKSHSSHAKTDSHGHAETHHEPDDHHDHHLPPGHLAHPPHESPWVVTVPLILLAIPSIIIGAMTVQSILHGDFFETAIKSSEHAEAEFHGWFAAMIDGFLHAPFWFAFGGFLVSTYIYLFNPSIADKIKKALHPIWTVLDRKYWFDPVYQAVFAKGSLLLGRGLWKGGDVGVIDNVIIDGSAATVGRVAGIVRWIQSGYLYTYAFAMILGLVALLGGLWWVMKV